MHLIRSKTSASRTALLPLVLAFLTLSVFACRHPDSQGASAPDAGTFPEVCERYLDAYGACMHRLLPKNADVADARIANARASLERLADPNQLRETCANGTTQLRASCH